VSRNNSNIMLSLSISRESEGEVRIVLRILLKNMRARHARFVSTRNYLQQDGRKYRVRAVL